MQLSELASLLSLAALEHSVKTQTLKPFLRVAGVRSRNGKLSDAFLAFFQSAPFTISQAVELLKSLQLDLISKRSLQEDDLQNIVAALANGLESVQPKTFALFLCFITSLTESERLQIILTILNNHPGLDMLYKNILIGIIPDLILVSYAAAVLIDPTWHLSNGFGTLSFSATKALLMGLAEETFEDVSQGMYLSTSELYPFLEACARNLSELLLQQTLIEHRVIHPSTPNRPQDKEASLLLISQSKKLFEKYLRHPSDLELVMSSVWKEWWTGCMPDIEENEIQRQEIELATTTQDILLSTNNTNRNENPPHLPIISTQEVEIPTEEKHYPMSQSDFYQLFQQMTGDLGKRLALVTIGRFFLLAALLCASGALGFSLVNRANFSIELSLLCVCLFNILLAIGALYFAGHGCSQSSGEAAQNVIKIWQSNKVKGSENQVHGNAGFQPMMKVVVDSLVPQQSACSMTPIRHAPRQELITRDSRGLVHGSPFTTGTQATVGKKLSTVSERSDDGSVTSRLKSIVTNIAMHLDKESSRSEMGPSGGGERSNINAQSGRLKEQQSVPGSFGSKSAPSLGALQTEHETFTNVNRHMRQST